MPGSGYGWKIQWAHWLAILQEPESFYLRCCHSPESSSPALKSAVIDPGAFQWVRSGGAFQWALSRGTSVIPAILDVFQRLQVLVFLPRFIAFQVDPLFPILCCEIVRSGISTSPNGRRIYLERLFPRAVEDDYKFYTAQKD